MPKADLHEVGSTADAAQPREGRSDVGRRCECARRRATTNCRCSCRTSKTIRTTSLGFAIIATTSADRTGKDKTALMFEIAHEPGALADTMAIFKRNRLNMTWIESFPIPGQPRAVSVLCRVRRPPIGAAVPPGDRDDHEKVAAARSARLLCADRAGRVDLGESSVGVEMAEAPAFGSDGGSAAASRHPTLQLSTLDHMRRKLIAGNWKMNTDRASAVKLARAIVGRRGDVLGGRPVGLSAVRESCAG